MIYTHVVRNMRTPAMSPLDRLRAEEAARKERGREKGTARQTAE